MDGRFYRREYDAVKTLEDFSAKLRDETDLDALRDDLVNAVKETTQPAHVTLGRAPIPVPKETEAINSSVSVSSDSKTPAAL